jgi:precorrin-2 dehydrogenase/sirohydrochlorin ferrochelatase
LLPIVLDGTRIRVAVAGRGDGLERRLALLANAGIHSPEVISGAYAVELTGIAVLFVAGLDEVQSTKMVEAGRSAGALVNVEDMPALCDFHVPAQMRRGDLLITISTSGRSPGLSRILRERLESVFGPEWGGILESVATARQEWREQGLAPDEVSRRTRAMMHRLK